METSFRELLNGARLDILPERESQVLALRYGLPDAETHTLEEVGRHFGLTKEGARQILLRAHRMIMSEGLSQLRNGLRDQPCARLALFTRDFVRRECKNGAQRLATLVMQEFQGLSPSVQVIKFIASLAYPSIESAKDDIDSALKALRERYLPRMKRDLALRKFKKLLSYVVWPTRPQKLTDKEMADIRRGVEESLTIDASSFYSAKTSCFVKFSSRVELNFYRLLEHIDEVVEYHEHLIEVQYEVKGQRLTCYPDLFILLRDRRGIVVEIMPVFRMPLRRNLVRFESLQKYCLKAGFGLLVTDGYVCLEQTRRYKVKQEYASNVMRYLEKKGTLDWNSYKAIRDRYRANKNDFVGLVVQNRLVWQLGPFRLSLSDSDNGANIAT